MTMPAKETMKDLKPQGSQREMLKALREQAKQIKEKAKALRNAMPHIFFGKKRVEIGDKGNILFYGLQKFPVSLYLNQVVELKQMINDPSFKISMTKPETEEKTA